MLAPLCQKKVIAQRDVLALMKKAPYMLHNLIFDQCTRPSEVVATAADVLNMVGCKNEAEMLRGKLDFVCMHILQYTVRLMLAWQMVCSDMATFAKCVCD